MNETATTQDSQGDLKQKHREYMRTYMRTWRKTDVGKEVERRAHRNARKRRRLNPELRKKDNARRHARWLKNGGRERYYKRYARQIYARGYDLTEALQAPNRGQAWTIDEDNQVMSKSVPDGVLSKTIGRSKKAIQKRRHKLLHELLPNSST